MAKRIYVIVANQILETKLVSFKFMFDSGAPYKDFCDIANVFGLLTLKEKDKNYVDPFRLVNGEPGAIGSDGYKRWNLNIFRCGEGLVLGMGVDETGKDEFQKTLREIPDSVILTHIEALDQLKEACKNAGVTLDIFNFNGTLVTS